MWTQVKAHSASSQDYNQSIYMTLKDDGQTFWSSGGSPTPEASEWLLYELPKPERICDVHIRTYDHSQIQGNPENLYAPVKVQILVGDTPEHFTFVSKEFEYCRRSLNNQSFSLLPNFAVGRFVKVLLIGKPQRQVGFDDQYYLALAFVGATTQKVPEKLATVAENTIQIYSAEEIQDALAKKKAELLMKMGESMIIHQAELVRQYMPLMT
jgi:hypothetical protein